MTYVYDTKTFWDPTASPTEKLLAIGRSEITNLEPLTAAKDISFTAQQFVASLGTVDEATGIYIRIAGESPSVPTSGIYMETDSTNSEQSTAIKIIHQGDNDAMYVATFSQAAALETASFANGSTGFISTCQWEGDNTSARDFQNSTLFNAVWGDDGTGGSESAANYGMFYASRSLGHSFRTQLQDPLKTGWAWGRIEHAISEFDLSRNVYELYNHGRLTLRSGRTSGASYNDADIGVYASYWDGVDPFSVGGRISVTPVSETEADWTLSLGAEGSESLGFTFGSDGSLTCTGDVTAVNVDLSGDITLDANKRLYLGSANSYIYGTGTATHFTANGVIRLTIGSGAISLQRNTTVYDNYKLSLGNGSDYWSIYNASSTRFELNSLTGLILKIDDGADDVSFSGGVGSYGTDPPATQPSAISDATDLASAITAINALLQVARNDGRIAT